MSIKRQDIGVLILYYCGYSRIKNLILRLKQKPITRFVTFHDLPAEALNCFETNLQFLKQNTNVVSIDDFMAGRLSYKKINVVITFDDGFKSWITYAVPILQKLVLPATFFISAGFVGLSKDTEAIFIHSNLRIHQSYIQRTTGCLTHNDVREIAEQGFTIGGHTLSHTILSALSDKDKLKYEIAEDKLALEKLVGKEIKYFAYPSGAFHNPDIDIAELLRKAGYEGAVTTISGFNNSNTNPFFLHRELTDAFMQTTIFKARVYGNHDAIQTLKKIFHPHK